MINLFNLNNLSSKRDELMSSISESNSFGSSTDYITMSCSGCSGGCDGTCNDYCKGNCTGILG